jgi:hypothetical protein
MSRYIDHSDDDSPEAILAQGRWEHNARAALKGKRGRQALRELREALLALPEKRLIDSALCTVGGPARVPDVTGEAVAARISAARARADEWGFSFGAEDAAFLEHGMRQDVDEERARIVGLVQADGEGCCGVAAYLWYRKVKAGMDPAEAFASLPTVASFPGAGALAETARLGQQAGLTYTLAWELAFRNDEIYDRKPLGGHYTPEERYTAFLAWIDRELAGSATVTA